MNASPMSSTFFLVSSFFSFDKLFVLMRVSIEASSLRRLVTSRRVKDSTLAISRSRVWKKSSWVMVSVVWGCPFIFVGGGVDNDI